MAEVQIPQGKTTSVEDLKNVPVSTKEGRTVLLRNLASIDAGSAVGKGRDDRPGRLTSFHPCRPRRTGGRRDTRPVC